MKKPVCAGTYTVVPNDYWNRFPRSSGASVGEWLAANNATADTPLYVGDKLCIPAGAKAPAPPPSTTTTEAPTTTAAPPPTEAPVVMPTPTTARAPATTSAPTTQPAPAPTKPPAPATTKPPAPATTKPPAPAKPANYTPAQIEALIREIWPDDIEERALTIAKRESGLRTGTSNWCCYGISRSTSRPVRRTASSRARESRHPSS